MKDRTAIRERYLRDSVPVRLGGLAANLRRIKSFASHDSNCSVVESLLDESKFFIEWTAGEAGIDAATELVELQIQLARWQRDWARIWTDPAQRSQIAEQSRVWSDRVLDMSGLLESLIPGQPTGAADLTFAPRRRGLMREKGIGRFEGGARETVV